MSILYFYQFNCIMMFVEYNQHNLFSAQEKYSNFVQNTILQYRVPYAILETERMSPMRK